MTQEERRKWIIKLANTSVIKPYIFYQNKYYQFQYKGFMSRLKWNFNAVVSLMMILILLSLHYMVDLSGKFLVGFMILLLVCIVYGLSYYYGGIIRLKMLKNHEMDVIELDEMF